MSNSENQRPNKANKGQVLVLVALSLVVFIGFAALAIDVAYFYHTRHQLQGAADAAALAGAVLLMGEKDDFNLNPDVLRQEGARQEAWKFACKNKAAGLKVYLASYDDSSNCEEAPDYTDLNGTNADGGDIVVGNWDSTKSPPFTLANGTTKLRINALKVVARRTDNPAAGTGMPQVKTFFGGIFGVIPGGSAINYVKIDVKAIAALKPPQIGPFPICLSNFTSQNPGVSPPPPMRTPIRTQWGYDDTQNNPNHPILCSDPNLPPGNGNSNTDDPPFTPLSKPGQVMFLQSSNQQIGTNVPKPGLAWTNFNVNECFGAPACSDPPDPGDVLPYLLGQKEPPDICNKAICTTEGTMQTLLGNNGSGAGDPDLRGQFLQKKKTAVYIPGLPPLDGWLIFIPVVSSDSCGTPQQTCPGAQGGTANPYDVKQYARVLITDVIVTGQDGKKGIRVLGLDNPRQETFNFTCKEGGPGPADKNKTITRRVTSIERFPCDQPLPTQGGQIARLVE